MKAESMDPHRPPPPQDGGRDGGGGGGGGGMPGIQETPACSNLPCAASLLGDVGKTTVSASYPMEIPADENIFGPFEAGFSSQQNNILQGLGCADPTKGYVEGGIDTQTAEAMVAHACGVQLPRIDSEGDYISLLDECGGHTREYHFHERLSCLYTHVNGSGHSPAVGKGLDDKNLYGKWENFTSRKLPKLDACGGHFGFTPDKSEVHYRLGKTGNFGKVRGSIASGAHALIPVVRMQKIHRAKFSTILMSRLNAPPVIRTAAGNPILKREAVSTAHWDRSTGTNCRSAIKM
eukprot:g3081.t1